MAERDSPEPGGGLDERLRRFREDRAPVETPRPQGLGFAMRIGTELVAALIVGTGLGYLLDAWMETLPLMSLLGFFFGAAAGMLNVYRIATGRSGAVGWRSGPGSKEG